MSRQIDWVDQQRVVDAILAGQDDLYFRHEGEAYMKYDQIDMDFANQMMKLSYKGKPVASVTNMSMTSVDVLTIQGLFGGVKVEINMK